MKPAANKPKRIGQHRMRLMHQVMFLGGPYDGQLVVVPQQPVGDELGLPIRVGEHVGRYNLNTGAWVPMEMAE